MAMTDSQKTFALDDDSVVVVIGSGAGGGTLANELAQQGIDAVDPQGSEQPASTAPATSSTTLTESLALPSTPLPPTIPHLRFECFPKEIIANDPFICQNRKYNAKYVIRSTLATSKNRA